MEKTPHELVDELDTVNNKINKLKPQLDNLSEGDKGNLAGLYERRGDLIYRLEQATSSCIICRGTGLGKKLYADEFKEPIKTLPCERCRGTGRQL